VCGVIDMKMENGRWKMEDVKRSEIPFAGEDEKSK
jgi:hypothetical protein